MTKVLLVLVTLIALSISALGQDPPAGETSEAREARIREEIRLLEAQIKYLNTIRSASGSSNITAATSGGSTTFATSPQANLETVSLSYEALEEIASRIDRDLKPTVGQYRGLVIYYEPDFLALTRYRLYREQVRMALANYESIVKRIEDEAKVGSNAGVSEGARPKSVLRGFGAEGLVTALSAPSIATSAIKSVAELASLFRTEQTITQSRDVVDKDSLGAVVAGTFLKANPNLVIYHPEQFVPEYEIGVRDENSLYSMLSRVNAAEAYLNYFLDQTEKIPAAERDSPPLNRIIAAAKVVQKQISNLGFTYPANRGDDAADKSTGQARVSEFRQMLRAEKLERVMSTGRVGVMKLRLLSSGGARRDKRNLLLGGKTDYSGSAVVEVALYDADGTMRASEVFSHHTGFRKFKTGEKSRL
jgi:hypothetical protein